MIGRHREATVFNIRRALSIGLITSALLAASLMQATPALAASTRGYGWNVECRDSFGRVTSNPGDVWEAVCLSVHVYAKTATGLKVDIIQVKHYAPNGWCYQGTQNELLKNGVVYRADSKGLLVLAGGRYHRKSSMGI